jgi:hypothetical protein
MTLCVDGRWTPTPRTPRERPGPKSQNTVAADMAACCDGGSELGSEIPQSTARPRVTINAANGRSDNTLRRGRESSEAVSPDTVFHIGQECHPDRSASVMHPPMTRSYCGVRQGSDRWRAVRDPNRPWQRPRLIPSRRAGKVIAFGTLGLIFLAVLLVSLR